MAETPYHLLPDNCFVCGMPKHAPRSHTFWSNADAKKEFAHNDLLNSPAYDAAAKYVADYRPY